MANELIIHYPTGATLYVLLHDATGQIWNGSAFAAPGSANWTDYDIAMTEVATETGIYRATMPAVAAGSYGFVVRLQAGANPAVADITVGYGSLLWDGSAVLTPAAAGAAMTLADDAITAAKFDEATAFPLVSADTGATQVARTGADADTLKILSDQIDGVPTGAEFEARTLPSADYIVVGDTLAAVTTVTNPVTAGTVSDKTGYALAADGLDIISTTAPAGVASNFREMLVQTWRRFFKRTTMTATQLKTWDDTNLVVVTTQTVQDDGTTQIQGPAV